MGVNLNQEVMTKGVLRAGAAYMVNDYNQPTPNNRVDNDVKALIGFDYNIKEWLKIGVDYILWNRNSNTSIYNFADNRFMMTVGVTY